MTVAYVSRLRHDGVFGMRLNERSELGWLVLTNEPAPPQLAADTELCKLVAHARDTLRRSRLAPAGWSVAECKAWKDRHEAHWLRVIDRIETRLRELGAPAGLRAFDMHIQWGESV